MGGGWRYLPFFTHPQPALEMHSTAASILSLTKALSAANVGWLMWLRKEGTEVEEGRDLRLPPQPPSSSHRENWASAEEPLFISEAEVVAFWKLIGLQRCCCATWVWKWPWKETKGRQCNSSCWAMLTAKFILCSTGCIITPALNNHVWVESLNGLVALNKVGKETNHLTLTLPPFTGTE